MSGLGLEFRTAASNGDIEKMMNLYGKPGLEISEAGTKTKKTAAHRAAEQGKVAALQLLHKWGDTFTARDNEGKTPSQLATDPECIKLFESYEQGAFATNPGLEFRTAASNGDIEKMLKLYGTPGLEISEAGEKTKKTAAHRAAEQGKVSVLRLLHNWGDPFTARDNKGKTPSQLATDPECVKMFELIEQGKKAVEVARQIFPDALSPESQQKMETLLDISVNQFRKSVHAKAKDDHVQMIQHIAQHVKDAAVSVKNTLFQGRSEGEWAHHITQSVYQMFEGYHTIDQADKMDQTAGRCGELSTIAYSYLTAVMKTKELVELWVSREAQNGEVFWNHTFLTLNRDPASGFEDFKGWGSALIVDPLEGRTHFFEHLSAVKGNTLIKKCMDIGVDITSSTMFDSLFIDNGKEPVPKTFFSKKAGKILQLTESMLEALLAKRADRDGKPDILKVLFQRLPPEVLQLFGTLQLPSSKDIM